METLYILPLTVDFMTFSLNGHVNTVTNRLEKGWCKLTVSSSCTATQRRMDDENVRAAYILSVQILLIKQLTDCYAFPTVVLLSILFFRMNKIAPELLFFRKTLWTE